MTTTTHPKQPSRTFDASYLEPLRFDFNGFLRTDGRGDCRGKGVIPEPSAEQLGRFHKLVQSLDDYHPSAMAPDGQVEAVVRSRMIDSVLAVAGPDGPTLAQLEVLPARALRGLFDFLRRALLAPGEVAR